MAANGDPFETALLLADKRRAREAQKQKRRNKADGRYEAKRREPEANRKRSKKKKLTTGQLTESTAIVSRCVQRARQPHRSVKENRERDVCATKATIDDRSVTGPPLYVHEKTIVNVFRVESHLFHSIY